VPDRNGTRAPKLACCSSIRECVRPQCARSDLLTPKQMVAAAGRVSFGRSDADSVTSRCLAPEWGSRAPGPSFRKSGGLLRVATESLRMDSGPIRMDYGSEHAHKRTHLP